MRAAQLPGRASLVAAFGVAALLAGCGRLEDALSPGRRADAAPARVALAARLPALSKAASGAGTAQLRVAVFYTRADGTRVSLGVQTVTLADAPTQQLPITIDLGACLADAQRAAVAGHGCIVSLEVTLVDGERVVDRQTVGPLTLQAGAVATVVEPVQLVEVAEVRVGPTEAGRVRLELGDAVTLAAAITSTTGQTVAGRPVTWSSDAPNVARVDAATGAVTATGLGRAHVTATTIGASGGVDVAVVPRPSAITIAGVGSGGGGLVRSSPEGIDCRVAAGQAQGTCTFTFPGDAQVTLTATPDFDATFGSWGGACALSAGATSCVLDAAQAHGATVSFAAQRRLAVGGSGVGTVTGAPGEIACQIGAGGATGACGAAYADGAVVTLTAAAGAQHTFAGWTGACAGAGARCTVTLTTDVAVGARFSTPLALSVSGDGEGSGAVAIGGGSTCALRPGTATPCAATFAYGTVVTLTAMPEGASTFAGWTGACSGTGPCRVTMDQARTVGATFVRRQVTLALSLGGPGSGALLVGGPGGGCTLAAGAGAAACQVRVPVGEPVTIVAVPATGVEFAGWSGACGGSVVDSCSLTPNGDLAIGARFTVLMVSVAVQSAANATGGGRVLGQPEIDCTLTGARGVGACAGSTPYGSSVTLFAAPNATSTFGGWGGECRASTGPTCVVSSLSATSVTATARFDVLRVPLVVARAGAGGGTVVSSPAGVDCPGTCTASFDIGTTVTLGATADASSAFSGWSGACAISGVTCVVSMDAARSVTATFVAAHPITVSIVANAGTAGRVTSTPSGIDCAGACARSFASGATVTLAAVPAAGSVFDGWSGACAGTVPRCTVTVTAALSVGARFVAAPPPATPAGAAVTLTARATAGSFMAGRARAVTATFRK